MHVSGPAAHYLDGVAPSVVPPYSERSRALARWEGDADDMTAAAGMRAGRREWIGLAVLALPSLLISMDLTVLNLAVPSLTADLAPSAAQLLWIVDIYGFLIAGSLITMGGLGDRIGRRRLLLAGGAAFGIASILAAFSTSAELLIASRAILGVAGATLMPSTLSLIRNMFHDPVQRTSAIGIWTTSFSVGGIIAPLMGGLLLEYYWWGSVFLVSVPVMLVLLAVGPFLLPEFRDPDAGRLDLVSAALSLVAILAVIYGIKRIAEDQAGWLSLLSIGVGLVLAAVFVRRQQRLADPLIDLRLFRVPAFSAALVTNLLSFFVMFGAFYFVHQYLQLVLGLTPWHAGLWTAPSSVGFIVTTMLLPTITRRLAPFTTIATGLVVASVGFGVIALVNGTDGLLAVVVGPTIFALGFPLVFILTTDLVVGSAPPERAGAASAMSETSVELGGALGIALLGSIGTAVYRAKMASAVHAGVPAETIEAARANLGGAVAVAGHLSPELGAVLLGPAREAFAQSLSTVAAISVAILLVTAAVNVELQRRARRTLS
jgi:MFS transporter, DHA2 family, multidrug resistance protein